MGYENEMKIEFDSRSCNEGFIRVAVSAFMTQLNPTLEEVADVKTAVSEAVTNCIVHAYDGKVEKITVSCHIEMPSACRSKIPDAASQTLKKPWNHCLRPDRRWNVPVWDLPLWKLLWMKCMSNPHLDMEPRFPCERRSDGTNPCIDRTFSQGGQRCKECTRTAEYGTCLYRREAF